MKIKNIIFLILIAILFAFPQKAHAENYRVHYMAFDQENESIWITNNITIEGRTKNEEIKLLFNILFIGSAGYPETYRFPKGTNALKATLTGDSLNLCVSPEILNYGGSFHEQMIRSQIIKTALDIEGVNKVSLYINGEQPFLAEGSRIYMAESVF